MPVTIRTPGEPDRQLQDLTAAEVDEAICYARDGSDGEHLRARAGRFADV